MNFKGTPLSKEYSFSKAVPLNLIKKHLSKNSDKYTKYPPRACFYLNKYELNIYEINTYIYK